MEWPVSRSCATNAISSRRSCGITHCLDQLYVVDNCSSDAAWEILQQLVAGWLPIRLGRDEDFEFVEQMTRQLRRSDLPFRPREAGAEL